MRKRVGNSLVLHIKTLKKMPLFIAAFFIFSTDSTIPSEQLLEDKSCGTHVGWANALSAQHSAQNVGLIER